MNDERKNVFENFLGKKVIIYAKNGFRFRSIILRVRQFGNNEFLEFQDYDGTIRLIASSEISNIEVRMW